MNYYCVAVLLFTICGAIMMFTQPAEANYIDVPGE